MKHLKWLNVKQNCELHTATMVSLIKNNFVPTYLSQLLYNEYSTHSYEARSRVCGDLNATNALLEG